MNSDDCGVCTDFKTTKKKFKKEKRGGALPNDFPCPPDKGELGRAGWTLLHTMAAYYPEDPTPDQQSSMTQFITGLSQFYPCGYCAEHMQQELTVDPPTVKNNNELSNWFCRLHNKVNVNLGKPEFDCSQVFKRWRKNPNCVQE